MSRFPRIVGVVIFGAAVIGALLIWTAAAMAGADPASVPRQGLVFGVWRTLYDTELPPTRVLLFAAGMALMVAAAVAVLERRISNRARRSENAVVTPLAPKLTMARTRGVFAGPITITVLIPAHNEEASLPATLASLYGQSRPPERVIVVADNCTDRTPQLAEEAGAEVFVTVENTLKKAGGLNQVLVQLLPGQGENDLVMVMDADTTLDDGFLMEVDRRMTEDRGLMAVGGLFYGEEGSGTIGQFQRNEYVRYQRELRRRRGRVYVLTGTASVFRPVALRTVAAERGKTLPGINGGVYDTIALTEDNELTLALKSLGALMVSPSQCTVVTEVMPSWRALWAQRLRWQRGALENLGAYGLRAQTFRYWAQQLGIGYGVIALAAYLLLMVVMALASGNWVWFPFWIGIGLIFTVERVLTVWRGGWRARLLAAMLFPELVYAMFLNLVYLKGVWEISLAKQATWTHVVSTSAGRQLED